MKPTLILVNTARGPIVNDDALYLALKEGWIAGAGLDDIEEGPAKQLDWQPANPLFSLDNVIITLMRCTTPKRRSARSATLPRMKWRRC
jgi:D-3-phosphoglycerate dehydrogenase